MSRALRDPTGRAVFCGLPLPPVAASRLSLTPESLTNPPPSGTITGLFTNIPAPAHRSRECLDGTRRCRAHRPHLSRPSHPAHLSHPPHLSHPAHPSHLPS